MLCELQIGHYSVINAPPADKGPLTVTCCLHLFSITGANLGPDQLTEVLQADSLKVTEVGATIWPWCLSLTALTFCMVQFIWAHFLTNVVMREVLFYSK